MSLSKQYPVKVPETTGSIRPIQKKMGSHKFTIAGYSIDKDIGKGRAIESTIFQVGGHYWSFKYYPNGSIEAKDDDISLYLFLKSKSEGVKAQFSFTILDQSGCALPFSETSEITSFKTNLGCGYPSFAKRAVLESNIKDDCFIIKCVVTVFKAFPVQPAHRKLQPQLRPGALSKGMGQWDTVGIPSQIHRR